MNTHETPLGTVRRPTEIRLYGHLRKRFGAKFRLHVASPAEAVRALCTLLPGFRQYLQTHSAPGYHVFVGKESLPEDQLALTAGAHPIKIVPAIEGAREAMPIILGAVLALTGFGGLAAGITLGMTAATAQTVFTGLMISGGLMMLQGVVSLLTQPPEMDTGREASIKESYSFNGPRTNTTQGAPVPVGYGRLMVGGALISSRLYEV